jgi:hypothetical protein
MTYRLGTCADTTITSIYDNMIDPYGLLLPVLILDDWDSHSFTWTGTSNTLTDNMGTDCGTYTYTISCNTALCPFLSVSGSTVTGQNTVSTYADYSPYLVTLSISLTDYSTVTSYDLNYDLHVLDCKITDITAYFGATAYDCEPGV